jgi:hypothetical protein
MGFAQARFQPDFVAHFPPLAKGGLGGVDRIVSTRASKKTTEKREILAIVGAVTPPDSPFASGGKLTAGAQQNDR